MITKLAYSVPEAAQALGISECHARRLVRNGTIPSVQLEGRIVVPKVALARFLDEQAAKSVTG
jgi:excisionase family DNA binding protein